MRVKSEILKPKSFNVELQHDFGVHISYGVVLRARNTVIEMIYDLHDKSFSLLPKYLYILRQTNPRTFTDLDVGSDDRFKHLFFSLEQQLGISTLVLDR